VSVEERRRDRRLAPEEGVAGQAIVQMPCQVVDVSEERLIVEVPVRPPVGVRCDLRLDVGVRIELQSRVQSVTSPLGPAGPHQLEIAFRSLRPEHRAALRAYLEQRAVKEDR